MDENFIQPLLTDFYQISMAYAYWKSGKIYDKVVFELYFRKNPFKGEFTIFAGLESCISLLKKFKYSDKDIDYLRSIMDQDVDPSFFEYLLQLNVDCVTISSMSEGSIVFPKVPLIIVEGPLIICQLLETGLLNLVNYASLVATNAARFRLAAGENKQLLEFGLRRSQGPDGGMSASRNCFLGGFNATSNVLAGKIYNIPVEGTHAHSFVTSYNKLEELQIVTLKTADGKSEINFVDLCRKWHNKATEILGVLSDQTNEGEMTSFISFALAFPNKFLCLVDTYDIIRSGVPNFISVALALNECGFRAVGVRIDSGDLAYLSYEIRKRFQIISVKLKLDWFGSLIIVASNDINEDTLHSLNQQSHSIDAFGIGTHLVTCQKQSALGCVFKMVEINGQAAIKLSEDIDKMTIPGKKAVYRLYGKDGLALTDYMTRSFEPPPEINMRLLCRHPSNPSKRAYVIPSLVKTVHQIYWKDGQQVTQFPSLIEMACHARKSLLSIRSDHKRALNPTPYKVSVSSLLYDFSQEIWMKSAPIGELF